MNQMIQWLACPFCFCKAQVFFLELADSNIQAKLYFEVLKIQDGIISVVFLCSASILQQKAAKFPPVPSGGKRILKASGICMPGFPRRVEIEESPPQNSLDCVFS